MLELIKSGGWLMVPIILCSVGAVAICIERAWTLNSNKIAPPNLLMDVWESIRHRELNADKLRELRRSSHLGRILAAGIANSHHGREIMKDSIEEVASHVVHDLERHLNSLGTIAAITPLLGLLGTVIGMIRVFSEIMVHGTGDAAVLAGGISEALVTTASGLSVAIPTLMMHRFYLRRIENIVVGLEQEAVKLLDALHGDRPVDIRNDGQ